MKRKTKIILIVLIALMILGAIGAISDDSGSKKGKIYTDGKEWVENMSPSEYHAFSKRAYEYNHRND